MVLASDQPIFIMDNGAYSIKTGLSTDENPHLINNCKMKVKSERQRQFIGDQIEDCIDRSGLYYLLSHQKGFITNWDIEREIWDYTINQKFRHMNPRSSSIILTEPYFNFKATQNNTDEILFEEYGFESILRTNAGFLTTFNWKNKTPSKQPMGCLVVDSGYSFTHIVPYLLSDDNITYKKIKQGIRRIDVGGKALTNHLKEIISYRQIHVMDETYVINQCKEDVCYVSTNFDKDLEECQREKRNKLAREYVLPDFTTVKRGFVRNPLSPENLSADQQSIKLANERFQVPELLFHPYDVGIEQVGIVEAIVHSINSLPEKVRPHLYENIVLVGGNAKFQGFRERIIQGLRCYCPTEYEVNIHLSEDPICDAWYGGKILATEYKDVLKSLVISRKQYDENGESRRQMCVDKFDT